MWDFVVDKVALEQVFSEYFGFPCQFSFHQLLQKNHPHLSSGVCTIGQSGRSSDLDRYLGTQSHPTNKKNYSAIADLHTLQITAATAKPFPSNDF
jgi:hypothetical protein